MVKTKNYLSLKLLTLKNGIRTPVYIENREYRYKITKFAILSCSNNAEKYCIY